MFKVAFTSLLAFAASLVFAVPAHAAKDDLLLVSAPLNAPFALDASSENPSVSRDGRVVAFSSTATNIVAGDSNGKMDIFVKDLATGAVELVSLPRARRRSRTTERRSRSSRSPPT